MSFSEINKDRIVPILDDFHYVKDKDKHISHVSSYQHAIVVIDDIYSLNIKDTEIIKSFTRFRIREFVASQRYRLINKWISLSDRSENINQNHIYQHIDKTVEYVDHALGKVFGRGIMPAYPFFILTIISTQETFMKPLDEEITSQGYCYQALIYIYLRKQGVRGDEIDTYMNFLTEFAYYMFSTKRSEINEHEFTVFIEKYKNTYNFPVEQKILLEKLQYSQIIGFNSFGNYSFCYLYIYYYFVAKYLAEHINIKTKSDDIKSIVDNIISNLHKDENAYIAVFITHHTKNDYVLDEIFLNSLFLFDKYNPATLSRDEMKYFDEQANIIIKEALPPSDSTPEKEREKRFQAKDEIEELDNETAIQDEEDESKVNNFEIDLRRSIKTMEVMGLIIKSRAGSLEKSRLESIFKAAMEIHLRILSWFFDIIKEKEVQQSFVNIISSKLQTIIDNKDRSLSEEDLQKLSKTLFWNINFFIVYGIMNKIIHSLGSDKLSRIVETVCADIDTPASYIVNYGISMWYNKNLQMDSIVNLINNPNCSEIAKKIIKFEIVDYAPMHKIGYKDRQKIEQSLRIPRIRLIK